MSSEESTPGRPRQIRYRELDALRGFAALGIVFWHYRAHFLATPLPQLFEPFYRAGFYCVDFFFVLSGVVLARAYLTEPRRHDLAGNLVRRLARIYPLHLATLIAVALLHWILVGVMHQSPPSVMQHNDLYHLFLNLTLSNYIGLQRGMSFNAPSWSISTEVYANLIFFLLIRVRRIRLDAVFLGLVVISVLLIAGLGNGRLDRSGTVLRVQVDLIRTILGFFTGVLLYVWVIAGRDSARGFFADGLFVLTLVLLIFGALGGFGSVPYAQLAAVFLGFPLLIVTAIRSRVTGRLLRLTPFTALGDISYSLYLIHFPVQILCYLVISAQLVRIDFSRPPSLFLYLALCLGLAALSHRLLEVPAQARINGWWRARPRGGDAREGGSRRGGVG
jgi:peptidoglycan/LPS O-acetylase OafA/YrhL